MILIRNMFLGIAVNDQEDNNADGGEQRNRPEEARLLIPASESLHERHGQSRNGNGTYRHAEYPEAAQLHFLLAVPCHQRH
ncbi:hypothetical protein D3C84_1234380 [compost metagenome]